MTLISRLAVVVLLLAGLLTIVGAFQFSERLSKPIFEEIRRGSGL